MTDRQVSIRLRASQWERILDMTLLGGVVYSRYTNPDPEEVEADQRVYDSLKAQLVGAHVVDDFVDEPVIVTVQVTTNPRKRT
jgi:hypothetical protein